MEQNIKRSEKVIKKFRDDWVDEKGYLHTKITKEIITGPAMTGQPAQGVEEPLLQRIIRPIRLKMRGMPLQPTQQPQQIPQAQQPKPQMDFGAMMKMGKKLMDDMGIDPKELIQDIFGEKDKNFSNGEDYKDLTDLKTDEKEVDVKWQKTTKKLKKPQKKIKLKNQKKKIQKTQNKSK